MALERNNTALQFEPGFDPEFERILQRHLKHGGAPVAACMGFDADTAIAFLENALHAPARSRYETHLAGCPACRRHVIELSRLAQLTETVPQFEPLAAPQQPGKAQWKNSIAEWFDFSAWQWNWQTAGLVGATAMAVVVAAVTINTWRRADRPEGIAEVSAPIVAASGDTAVVAQSPTPDFLADSRALPPMESGAASTSPSKAEADAQTRVSSAVPPPVGATQNKQAFTSNLPPPGGAEQRSRNFMQMAQSQGAAPPSAQPVDISQVRVPQQNISSAQNFSAPAAPAAPAPSAKPLEMADKADNIQTELAKGSAEPPKRLGPSSEDNPMRGEPAKPKKASKLEAESGNKKAGWIDRVMAFAPTRKSDRGDKPGPVIRDEDANRFLISRIHNRVFRFENGAWVDQEYKDELMQWRVTRLVRGSDEFNRVLADEPQLKPYFDKTPILVIWRDKIYKVVVK